MDRDFFVPRPRPDLSGFSSKAATAADAAYLGALVFASLKVPEKDAQTAQDDQPGWRPTKEYLLPGLLPEGWTNHSERASLPSALAATGIAKERRNMLGRWRPDGSDEYVRTYRAAARSLIGVVLDTVAKGVAYTKFDGEDAVEDVKDRLMRRTDVPSDLEENLRDFALVAKRVAEDLRSTEEWAEEATEVATVIPEDPEETEEEAQGLEASSGAGFIVSYAKGRRSACIHRVLGCWRAKELRFGDYDYVDSEGILTGIPTERCKRCWRKGEEVIGTVMGTAEVSSSGSSSGSSSSSESL